MMSKPRCGFPDITHNYGYYSTRRRWRSNTVNYAYDNYGKHSYRKTFLEKQVLQTSRETPEQLLQRCGF